jgi:hyaluronan synthase
MSVPAELVADHPAPRRDATVTAVPRRADATGRSLDERVMRLGALAALVVVVGTLTWHVSVKARAFDGSSLIGLYTIIIGGYVLSRFVLAAIYRPPMDVGLEPSVAVVVPAYNEGEAVVRTIDACLALDYPREKLEIVVVNDGSSDDTWEHMERAAARHGDAVVCLDLGSNQGKRAAMAAGTRATSAEVLVFVDSDSVPAPGAVRKLVQGFANPYVGAVAGLTYVRNAHDNVLTRMQAARYFVSYQLLKSAESVVSAVACCSGCFSAYRRKALEPVLDRWEHQRFLGVACTYGDDRALTNLLIRKGWRTIYDCQAEAWTDAPARYHQFFRQQLRWKKSWAREGPLLLAHIWRSRPVAFPFVLINTVAGLISPLVLAYNLVWVPADRLLLPVVYLLGLYLVSFAYGLLYRTLRNDGLAAYAVIGTVFYMAFSVQLIWAIIRLRDSSWGTRGS